MNILSLKLPVKLPRLMIVLAAFCLPLLASAGFYLPPTPAYTGVTYSIAYYGSIGMTAGVPASLQMKLSSATTWSTMVTGYTTYYGGISLGCSTSFSNAGTYNLRVIRNDYGSVVATSSFTITSSAGLAPVPAVSVSGYSSGTTIPAGTTITVYYSATDPNANLTGIRYNAWNATTGYFDNGGGAYVTQSGSSGQVTKTFTLSAGDWYFWTEAIDATSITASTPSYASGYKITAYSNTTYCTPAYQPTYWNDGSTIQYNNNCYNYANNRRTDTFAQPGRASGNMYSEISAAEVRDGAISDGLIQTTASGTSPDGRTLIALVVAPGYDYHWYRKDSNGYWTHKPGGTQATNVDNSGNVITNPETANRGVYTEFVGYFFTPSDCTQGQGHANIN